MNKKHEEAKRAPTGPSLLSVHVPHSTGLGVQSDARSRAQLYSLLTKPTVGEDTAETGRKKGILDALLPVEVVTLF